MFSIGDFARYGRVSVRMLRHYDAIGLLRPAHVEPATGYRFYDAGQLARLNRVVALKDLGFTLQQVRQILDEQVTADQLRGMLRLRQAELQTRIAEDTARLGSVTARLRTIESEGRMSDIEITVKALPAVRVAALRGTATAMEPGSIGPVVRGLFDDLCAAMDQAGITPVGPAVAWYEDAATADGASDAGAGAAGAGAAGAGAGDAGAGAGAGVGEQTVVHAGMPVDVDPDAGRAHGFVVLDLPAVERAATVVHRGSMDGCLPTYQALGRWIEANGYRSLGTSREITLACPGGPDGFDAMVTEIQEPIVAA